MREREYFTCAALWRMVLAAGFVLSAWSGSAWSAAVTDEFSYDGTYAPNSPTPPSGQSTWTVVTTGGLGISPNTPASGVASFPDNSSGGRIQMSSVFTDPAFIATPSSMEWEYSFRMSVTSPGFPRTVFGVRDEGGNGKFIMFAHSSTGANLFYTKNDTSGVLGSDILTGANLGDGLFHDYRAVKFDDAGTMKVNFYLDDVLYDTRDYSSFDADISSGLGFGVFTSTPGQSDYVIDDVYFGPPTPGPAPEPVLVLVDINADGTNRNATTADFEAAMGLASGTFSGESVNVFPNNNPGGGLFSQTVNDITVQVSDISNDADGWFGAGSNNNLLDDGLYHRDTGADPTALITLSGSGLGLAPKRSYELYMFAGRSQGHETTFTFDPNNPMDPSGGVAIHTDPPVVGGDNTLGTALFTFATGPTPPSSLVIRWDGARHANGNQDAVFSGFALRDVGEVPEPVTAALALLGLGGLGAYVRRRRAA